MENRYPRSSSSKRCSENCPNCSATRTSFANLGSAGDSAQADRGVAERGFAGDQLEAIRRTTNSQESDLFDVLAYIAYLRPPLKRAERADSRRESILSSYEPRHNLPELLQLKYDTAADAMKALGSVSDIRATFRGFQRGLYDAPELDRDLK